MANRFFKTILIGTCLISASYLGYTKGIKVGEGYHKTLAIELPIMKYDDQKTVESFWKRVPDNIKYPIIEDYILSCENERLINLSKKIVMSKLYHARSKNENNSNYSDNGKYSNIWKHGSKQNQDYKENYNLFIDLINNYREN